MDLQNVVNNQVRQRENGTVGASKPERGKRPPSRHVGSPALEAEALWEDDQMRYSIQPRILIHNDRISNPLRSTIYVFFR